MASLDDPNICNDPVTKLFGEVNSGRAKVTTEELDNLRYFCFKGYESKVNDKFGEPLVVIGVYIALASFICILCVVADSIRSKWRRKDHYQIPSKFFSLNVTCMTLITIAMKLPVDLSASMPGNLDQVAKIGSIAFMCTVLAILNPSLASMDNKKLWSNIIGLVIFVVTISVNLFIEIGTGVISDTGPFHVIDDKEEGWRVEKIYYSYRFVRIAATYIGIMILLLLISISTAIIIPSIKKTLEFKYDQLRKEILNGQKQHTTRITSLEELTQQVTRYWIMSKTGSPQFVMARNIISYASLALCSIGIVIYAVLIYSFRKHFDLAVGGYQSNYKWSIPVILIVQFIYSVLGTILLILRCIGGMRFREFSLYSHMLNNLREEKYWTAKLFEWKRSRHIGVLERHHKLRDLVHFIKKCVLSLCIRLQKAFVVFICGVGMGGLIFLEAIIMIFDACLKRRPVVVSTNDDLKGYILRLDDEVEASQKVVETLSMSMNHLIERAKKKQNDNLLELLEKSKAGLEGIGSFYDVISVQKLNSWSVPVLTLACIAVAVPGRSEDEVKRLIESIDEALLYTYPVEEIFDSAHEFVNIRKKAMTYWDDCVRDKRWRLENPIGNCECGAQLPIRTCWFKHRKAEPILKESTELDVAGLMPRIKDLILSKNPNETDDEGLFELLRSMIADILVACFSNIPRVIMMKCHANEIEKREKSVVAAVKLLGRSTKIIELLEERTLPGMDNDPDKRASFDEWCLKIGRPLAT